MYLTVAGKTLLKDLLTWQTASYFLPFFGRCVLELLLRCKAPLLQVCRVVYAHYSVTGRYICPVETRHREDYFA